MNTNLLSRFRAMQLALANSFNTDEIIILDGNDTIPIGDNLLVSEIILNKDAVVVSIFDAKSIIPINKLSDEVVEVIINVMQEIALRKKDKLVYISSKKSIIYIL